MIVVLAVLALLVRNISPANLADTSAPVKHTNPSHNGHYVTVETCVVHDETFGKANEHESKLWYFRQDVFANAHHYYWQLYHELAKLEDRQGEMFYFMHHEMIARYITERTTNQLSPLASMSFIYGYPLIAFDSYLTETNSGFYYAPREEGAPLGDVGPARLSANIAARESLVAAVDAKLMMHQNGTAIPINNFHGIDVLAHALEPSNSINVHVYGSYHHFGHYLMAGVMDPTGETGELGVMASTSTTFRDPIFYEFHQNIDNIFVLHKSKFEPYTPTGGTEFPLKVDSVKLLNVEVKQGTDNTTNNVLETHWSHSNYSLPLGLDWLGNEQVEVCTKQLDYNSFEYWFEVESGENNFVATFRILLAPRHDSEGRRFTMEEQRLLFFTLDIFTQNLTSGVNTITRSSIDSQLTIPTESWHEEININATDNFCGCGWPRHLLLPKGTPEGFTFDLFVMITDGAEEFRLQTNTMGDCPVAPIWCSVSGGKYPFSRPAGYPFDRKPYSIDGEVVPNLEEYIKDIPNMKVIQVRILHRGE